MRKEARCRASASVGTSIGSTGPIHGYVQAFAITIDEAEHRLTKTIQGLQIILLGAIGDDMKDSVTEEKN